MFQLFWFVVDSGRAGLEKKKEKTLEDFWKIKYQGNLETYQNLIDQAKLDLQDLWTKLSETDEKKFDKLYHEQVEKDCQFRKYYERY